MRKLILIPAVFLLLACQDRTPVQPDLEVAPEMAVGKLPVTVMRVIAKGAALHGANGINFGPDGNLYIASVFGQEIVVMNPRNGKIIDSAGHGRWVWSFRMIWSSVRMGPSTGPNPVGERWAG
jgi:hypothetical protein